MIKSPQKMKSPINSIECGYKTPQLKSQPLAAHQKSVFVFKVSGNSQRLLSNLPKGGSSTT